MNERVEGCGHSKIISSTLFKGYGLAQNARIILLLEKVSLALNVLLSRCDIHCADISYTNIRLDFSVHLLGTKHFDPFHLHRSTDFELLKCFKAPRPGLPSLLGTILNLLQPSRKPALSTTPC